MKKFDEFMKESLAAEMKSEPRSMAAKQARQMGLTYVGFGRYADRKGRVAYTVDNDRLVPFKSVDHVINLYDKADMTRDPQKRNELTQQADTISKAYDKRFKEDEKIVSQKEKEALKTAKKLASFYRPEMFDEAEIAAIQDYTGDAFNEINRYLYKGYDEGTDANTADAIGRTIDALDSAFDETQAPFSFTVYSGLSGRYRAEKIIPGQEYIFRGYISTSLSHDVAISNFTDSDEPVVLQIEINKGDRAIFVDSVSATEGELETILPRGSKIKVISGPHRMPWQVINGVDEDNSSINLFHCTIVQD